MTGLDPHYLHEKRGLQAIVSPPVEQVTALDWHPRREEVIAATRDGRLVTVDPVMGTRDLADDLPEAGAVAISPEGDRVAVLGRGAPLQVRSLPSGELLFQLDLELLGGLWVGWWRQGLVVAGEGLDGRRILVLDHKGRRRASGELPPGVVVGVDEEGRIMLGRVTSQGAQVIPLGTQRFDATPPTSHRLVHAPGGRLVGVAEGGVTVWANGAQTVTVRSFGVSAATLTPDGAYIALGTRDGEVALTPVDGGSLDRAHPGRTGGHDEAVRILSFSRRGRWLASVGESCWLWSW